MMERSSMQGGRYTYGARLGALCGALILFIGFGLMSIPGTARAASTTVLTVTNLNGSGAGSLRAAINKANAGGTYDIVFASGLSGTITVKSTLDIDAGANVTIDGGGSIAISGGHTATTTGVQVMSVASGATLELDNITIEDGYTTATVSDSGGGGIHNLGTLRVTNSTFSGNTAAGNLDGFGGGIYNGGVENGGKLTVTNSIFSGNSANWDGGAISTEGDTLIVTNSIFSGNYAGFGGGAIWGKPFNVSNSTFSGNDAANGFGGGIDGNTGSVTNSTFSGDLNGGGITGSLGGTLNVSNSTFSSSNYDISIPATLKGTILAGNSGYDCSSTITDDGYNIATDNSCGFKSSNHSYNGYNKVPLFSGGLANNGGPTETLALAPATAAIDAIPAADCPAIDQRGYARPDEGESVCDIGAYESGATATRAKLQIDTSTGSFDLNTPIIFAGAVDPVTQNVTLQIGTYSVTIPAGSFVLTKKGDYVFQGTIDDVSLQVRLVPQSDGSYTLQLQGSGAALSGSTNPVTVTLTMTDANGNLVATSGIAAIASIN